MSGIIRRSDAVHDNPREPSRPLPPRQVVYTSELVDGVDPRDRSTWPYPLWGYDNQHRIQALPWEIHRTELTAARQAEAKMLAELDQALWDEWRNDWRT